jgi:hypothetical protein
MVSVIRLVDYSVPDGETDVEQDENCTGGDISSYRWYAAQSSTG